MNASSDAVPCPPVLLTMFNRPEHAKKVLDALRAVKPGRLYLAVDGPREGSEADPGKVAACCDLARAVDWECEVRTRFRETNLGCREGMLDAISWFLEEAEEGVVLEDDCLPHPEFFPFAGEGFERYRHKDEVMQISGFAFIDRPHANDAYFLPLTSCWGWATTNEIWKRFCSARDSAIADLMSRRDWERGFDLEGRYPYSQMLKDSLSGKNSSWAVQFYAFVYASKGLVLFPPRSLVSNIGFDGSGAHGGAGGSVLAERQFQDGAVEIRYPEEPTTDFRRMEEVGEKLLRERQSKKTGRSPQRKAAGRKAKRKRSGFFDRIAARIVEHGERHLARTSCSREKKKEKRSAQDKFGFDDSVVVGPDARFRNLARRENVFQVGKGTHILGELLTFWDGGRITIGENCYIGDDSRIWSQASVTIGNDVLISHLVDIHDTDGHPLDPDDRVADSRSILSADCYLTPTKTKSAPVVIEDRVWIGFKATILKGVTLGYGSIVAAGSVVTKDVAPLTIVAGNPARPVGIVPEKAKEA